VEANIAAPVLADEAGRQRVKERGEVNEVLIWAGRE